MRRRTAVLAALALLAGPAASTKPEASGSFAGFLAELRRDAAARGVSDATFEAAFRDVKSPDPAILARTKKQGEFSRPVWDYLVGAVTPGRIARGRARAQALASTLRSIETRYGVPESVVLAIWGVDSDFGASAGTVPTVKALATLAAAGHRGDLFRNELLDALQILQRGDISPAAMSGSWAGAMGQVQFLPSTYLGHAVDFDGDGRRDIWRDDADALASIAAYLKDLGWNPALSWGYEVRLPTGFDLSRYAGDLSEFSARGIVRADGGACRHLAQHRHFEDFRAAQPFGQAYAPRLVRRDVDVAGLAQGGDVLARHAARGKTEARGDIGQARRLAVVGDALTDELEDGAAFWGKIVHGAHLYSF